jgi:hypothetical protein
LDFVFGKKLGFAVCTILESSHDTKKHINMLLFSHKLRFSQI